MAVDISLVTDGATGLKRIQITDDSGYIYPARTDTFTGQLTNNWGFRAGNEQTYSALWDSTAVSGGNVFDPVATKRAAILALLAEVETQYLGGAILPALIAAANYPNLSNLVTYTYVAAGDGIGEVETETRNQANGSTITLTYAYDAMGRISTITKVIT